MQLTAETIQLVRDIGVAAFIVLLLVMVFAMFVLMLRERNKADTKESGAVTHIALDSTEEAFRSKDQIVELIRQVGDVREALGRSQGENTELRRNFEASENKREEMRNKILELDNTSKIQQATIARHEGRIAQLETENTNQAKLIVLKETRIVELETENTTQRVTIESQAKKITEQENKILLLTRAQRFGDTVKLTDEELLAVTKELPPVETQETSTNPSNEPDSEPKLPKAS